MMKKIFNYIMLSAAVLAGMSLTACDDDDLCTDQYDKDGVNILGFGPMPITRGETMRLTGTDLDKVKEVLFPGGNQKLTPSTTFTAAQFSLTSDEEMTVTIPDECVPGKIRLVTQRGDTVVSASNISFVEEIEVKDINPKHVSAGDVITISGEYVWNIAEVTLAMGVKIPAEEFLVNTRKEIKFAVPAEAQSGAVTYNDGSESGEDVVILENLEVEYAKVTGISNDAPEFGEEITIYGENFNLLTATIDFPSVPGVSYALNAACTEMTVTVPMNTVSGSIVLTSVSGLTTSVAITLPLATFESVTPNEELNVGDEVTIKGELLDRIVRLDLPGGLSLTKSESTDYANDQFLYNKRSKVIKFRVPEGMSDGAVTMVQHENYSVATDKIKMHHESGSENVIWQSSFSIGSWDGGMGDLSWGGFDWTTVSAGQVLTVYFTPNMVEGWAQIRLGNGSWSALPSTKSMGDSDGNIAITEEDNCVRVTLTDADLNALQNEGGLVVCGAWFTVTKITLSGSETVLWEGELIADDWGNQPYALSDAGEELLAAGAQPGQAVNFFLTPIEPGWKLEILEGHWGPSYGAWCAPGEDTEGGKFEEWDLEANGGKVTIYLTQEMLDAAYTQQWWGGVFVLNGDNVKCTKITLE